MAGDDTIRVTPSCSIPLRELRFRTSRSGGPGGQNVNTRDTRVELVFDVAGSPSLGPRQRARLLDKLGSRLDSRGVLRIVASQERSQAQNRARAIERFRALVADALKEAKPRRATRPSRAAEERRLEAKRVRSRTKRGRSWQHVPDE